MKFSWELVKHFIQITKEDFTNIKNKLILFGIEIESISNIKEDKILDLSITTNRKEINSALSLAREISIISNKVIRIKKIEFNYKKNIKKKIDNCSNYKIEYFRSHKINIENYKKTPKWVKYQLEVRELNTNNVLRNIQKYIELKWGETFQIIYISTQEKNKSFTLQYNKYNTYSRQKALIVFKRLDHIEKRHISNEDSNEFYENYYIDSLSILKTISKETLGKAYENFKKVPNRNQEVILPNEMINKYLGQTNKKGIKFLETEKSLYILKRLKLYPKYSKKKKEFLLNIPNYRKHDLCRPIDIIEEIGKIYEFRNFYGDYRKNIKKGCKSYNFIKIRKIKQSLINLGFNEVVNCSLTRKAEKKEKSIKLYNPINEDQSFLRNNIHKNLIKNYKYNAKYSNNNILTFEIGKVFKDKNKNYLRAEERSLGILLSCNEYKRYSWQEKTNKLDLLDAKGFLEIFLERLNANTALKQIGNDQPKFDTKSLIKNNNIIGIYNKENNEIIGKLGEVKQQYIKDIQSKETKIYIVEMSLKKLIKTIRNKKHLEYRQRLYSDYPVIQRDISIRLNRNIYIKNIIEAIRSIQEECITDIQIFNEYIKINKRTLEKERFIGIRITYRSSKKTLYAQEIEIVEEKINNVISSLNLIS
uniref:phenylalanine--tRNA ligase n=1 Tax=Tolypiocladia glomerulata TaxID=860646 RepID=A0A1Z1MUS4_9FLOR|nr:Phenylalanine-tRNA ligase beta subunit [Tolypiocladia glomerulata]ARW69833.1 Phenylalanine-tRNA ligase beta subunit [Tolypiocladia glomerulata]